MVTDIMDSEVIFSIRTNMVGWYVRTVTNAAQGFKKYRNLRSTEMQRNSVYGTEDADTGAGSQGYQLD